MRTATAFLATVIAFGAVGTVEMSQPQPAQAASYKGVSANTTLTSYTYGKNVTLYVKNDNFYDTVSLITPQKKVDGKWKDLDWYDSAVLGNDQSERLTYTSGSGKDFKAKGTYRFKVESSYGDNASLGTLYTGNFSIK